MGKVSKYSNATIPENSINIVCNTSLGPQDAIVLVPALAAGLSTIHGLPSAEGMTHS